ncbi:coniferyl aldehyde dehydrogenase [Streptomyces sp. DT195]|uniref:coniferyl aldehyde dehydrogenase n=1 Tax=Streptomyces sp. DT195 TaxID=3393419 RepID=UPI003CEC8B20
MSSTTRFDELTRMLQAQRDAFLAEGPPALGVRLDRLERLAALVRENGRPIVEAISADFGHRSPELTELSDVADVIGPIRHAQQHLADWMRPEVRQVNPPLDALGALSRVEYQPLGVIGVMAPWNSPARLALHPLIDILSAGNKAMLKLSELTPLCSDLLAELVPRYFDATEVGVVTGGPDVAAAFSELPFDHLIFTGGTVVGRKVMRAAAENLVPVTLELGGKCPVIVGRSADTELTADRIAVAKFLNSGQACIAPDYLLVPEERLAEYVDAIKRSTAEQYPTLVDNPDYTSIINAAHFERIAGYVSDARARGAEVIEINPSGEDLTDQPTRKYAPTLIIEPAQEALVSTEEIFGPLLPIKTYRGVDEAIAYVNARPRPLALYYFGQDKEEERRVLSRTTSGNAVVNDIAAHTFQYDLPFGGVGASGMGSYRGQDGFRTFSHAKGVFVQSDQDVARMSGLRPPFNERTRALIDALTQA